MGMALSLPLPEAGEPVYYSSAMVDALNSGDDREAPYYECVYGELFVTVDVPRPWHAAIVERLHRALIRYSDREPAAGYVSAQPMRVTFGRADVNVRPDLWVIRTAEWRAQDWDAITVPLLLAEVLSDSTQRKDRFQKHRAYMEAGVPLYWIVDADARSVEVWTPGVDFPRVETAELAWEPAGAAAPFRLALVDLFAPL